MTPEARKTLRTIRRCVAADRVLVLPHFIQRMDERGLVWPDVLTVLDAPATVQADGMDDWGRPRWIVSGEAADGLSASMVCVLSRDARGESTVFITLFWEP